MELVCPACNGNMARFRIADTTYVVWRCEDCGEFHPGVRQDTELAPTGTEEDGK